VKQAFVSAVAAVALFQPVIFLSPVSCSSHHGNTDAPVDAGHDVTAPPQDAAPPPKGAFCSLPGSVVWSAQGPSVVGGVPPSTPDLTWLTLPAGFCAHYFGTVPDVRQIRLAPGGDLFATSPRTATTGGNYTEGLSAIIVLPDDDKNGIADTNIMFLGSLPSSQGILFANGSLYYQDDATIRSVPYHTGDRMPSASPQAVTTITAQQDGLHWPKVMDVSSDGTIYITNGGSQGDQCVVENPTRGAIFALQPDGTTSLVAKGFRNPIAMKCEPNHKVCLAAELALDYSGDHGGREKVVPVRAGDDWGYPCCATKDIAYTGTTYADGTAPNCSGVAAEGDSFVIGHTPFGLDFESGTGKWPAPWAGRVYVTLHGVAGSWEGARVVAIGLDPSTGLPVPATELDSGAPNPDAMLEFASGWDDNMHDHGRPAPVAFGADGRLFLGNDRDGTIVWIAPIGLTTQ
jgi:glucose/arabinose dehydrogenase